MLGTLALEDAVKVRASIAQRDAGGMGRRKNQILGEPEKLSSLNETKSLSSILGCEEKTEISSLQEFIERSYQLFVSINALMRRFLIFNFVKMLPLDTHPSSFILSINLMRNIILKLLDKKNCAEILSRSNERV